ncbi:hypothetical protein CEV32_2569 [Brucella rhizosphaerae]|uniref:Uncharacterized protein n=1 Tax=Brucella rhizosphaerae TaxID=571254 RepID=A0A256F5K6_9HYPH|nr:hypothetical protein CEV32_2569 [Brucella rhizosphaerae]
MLAELKRVAFYHSRTTRFNLLFLRMSISQNRFPLLGDVLQA